MTINPHIACYQVVARNSRGDAAIYEQAQVPGGWEVIQHGPDRITLLAQLAGCSQAAAHFLGTQT
jgi:hypothetical protein